MDVPPALVERAQQGDRAAFAALYDTTSRPLYLYVLAHVRHVEDAEDAAHAAYVAAWHGLPGLRRPDRFAAWLFRIARNAARSAAREASRHAPGLASLPDGLPAQEAREDGDARSLAELLDGLDGETRALLVLRFGLGWSVETTAEVLDVSAPTLRRRVARAVEHLRARERERTHHGR